MLCHLIRALTFLLNLQMYDYLLYEQENPKYVRYPAAAAATARTAANIFIYFYLNNTLYRLK